MSALFDAIWQFNYITTLLICAILAARWVLRKSAGLYNSYWLWVALPLTPVLAWYLLNFTDVHHIYANLQPAAEPLNLPVSDIVYTGSEGTFSNNGDAFSIESMAPWLSILLLAGSVFCLIRLVSQHIKLRHQLRSPAFNLHLDLHSRYPINGVDQHGFSPAVYGFFSPNIYFPLPLLSTLDKTQCELIIRHEEEHIRQGHLWLNLGWDLMICLLWFNPVLYVARRSFRHDQEVFCDSLVLKDSSVLMSKAYGNALISTVSATHSVSLLCSWKMFDQLEERIMNIKSQHLLNRRTLLGSALTLILAMGSLYAIATAHEPEPGSNDSFKKKKSINIVKIDTDDKKQVTITTGGKTYRLEDGEKFILEDGKRRDMSEEELEKFTELLAKSKEYDSAKGRDKGKIFQFENVHAFTFDHDGPIDMDELKAKLEGIMPPDAPEIDDLEFMTLAEDIEDVEFITVFADPEEKTDAAIKRALEQSKNSKRTAVEKARKKLEATQRKLAKSREQLEQQRKIAQEQAKKLNELARENG